MTSYADDERDFLRELYASEAETHDQAGTRDNLVPPGEYPLGGLLAAGEAMCDKHNLAFRGVLADSPERLRAQYLNGDPAVLQLASSSHTYLCPELPDITAAPATWTETSQPAGQAEPAAEPTSQATASSAPVNNGVRAVEPTPTTTTEAATAEPTVAPYLYPFDPQLVTAAAGGAYERGRAPCARGPYDPLWTTVTRYAWICEDGTVIMLDAELGHEAWTATIPTDNTSRPVGSNSAATGAVGNRIADVALSTTPAVGLSAATHELVITILDGDTGRTAATHTYPASANQYWVWWSTHHNRLLVAYDDNTETRQVTLIDTATGDTVAEFTRIRVLHEEQRIDSRYIAVKAFDNDDTLDVIDLETGEYTPAAPRLHRGFEYERNACSPYLLIRTGLLGDWHLLDPATGISVDIPDRYYRELLTDQGALIHNDNQWAMLTPNGITWTIDRDLARQPTYTAGELAFANQSGERIAVDTATGTETGPATFSRQTHTPTSNGYLHGTSNINYQPSPLCASAR